MKVKCPIERQQLICLSESFTKRFRVIYKFIGVFCRGQDVWNRLVSKHACVVFTAMEPASSFLVANLCVHIFRFPCTFFAVKFCFDVSVLPPRKELRWSAKSLAERTHGLGEYTLVSRNHMKKGKKSKIKL